MRSDGILPRCVLLAGLAVASPALASPRAEPVGTFGVGYRHSLAQDAGGLALSAGVGGFIGPIGVEYQAVWSSDHTLKPVERLQVRSTSWLNLAVRLTPGRRVDVGLAAGPGIGWLKQGGKAFEVGGRHPSYGVHEEFRFGFKVSDDDLLMGVRLTVGAEHLWQYAIVPAPEHAITGGLTLTIGPEPRW